MINLESENISTTFLAIFWTMAIPANRSSYSSLLFVAEKLNLKDFSIVTFLGDIKTSPSPEALQVAAPSTYTLQDRGSHEETIPTNFPSMPYFSAFSSTGDSANSATKSTRTWPLTKVGSMYLMSKAPRIVPHLAILPMKSTFRSSDRSGSWVKKPTMWD